MAPGHLSVSPRSDDSGNGSADVRNASNYREHRQTVDVDR